MCPGSPRCLFTGTVPVAGGEGTYPVQYEGTEGIRESAVAFRRITFGTVPMGSFYSKCAHGVATAAYGEGSFLELRVEETTILLGIIGAGLYCTAVYLTIWTAALPIRMIVSYSWDVVIASMLALIGLSRMSKRPPSKSAIAALPEAEQEKAKKQLKAAAKAASLRRTAAMALCATVALVRWYFGSVREALKL